MQKKHIRDYGKLVLFRLLTVSEPTSVKKMLSTKANELTLRWLSQSPVFVYCSLTFLLEALGLLNRWIMSIITNTACYGKYSVFKTTG